MKNSKKFFVYAVCILLSVVIACSTVMVGATDDAASSNSASETTKAKPTGTDLLYTEESIPTDPHITDTISQIVSQNGWEDDLSNVGQEIVDGSNSAAGFLERLIESLENAFETFIQFFRQIFRIGFFD